MAGDTNTHEPAWPFRTWVLMAVGAIFALLIQQLKDLPDSGWDWGKRMVASAIIFLAVSGISFGLSWRRGRPVPSVIVALICGVIAGGVMLWNGTSSNPYDFVTWPLCSGIVSAAVILVLFQAADRRHPYWPAQWSRAGVTDWKRQALVYEDVHEAAWTDALLGGLSGVFMGIVMLLFVLLAEMFHLVKIELIRDLLKKDWVVALVMGAAFGAALGLLRDRAAIIAALQRVAMMVLRVLAPVLAVGLVAFLAVLPFTGLAPLWATGETTPITLAAALIALFLVNAVIGDKAEDAGLARPLRWGAMALALVLLPLTLIAAWSTGLRIGQHGFSPDRLWALTFIILGCVTAVAYAVAILRRGDWVSRLYRSNLHLALILGVVSLILSTSIVSFDRIATASQVARLESGKVAAIDFDYAALWFDYGPPGQSAIRRLAEDSKDEQVRRYAQRAQEMEARFEIAANVAEQRVGKALEERLTILPEPVSLDPELRDRLPDFNVCGDKRECLLHFVPGDDHAVAVSLPMDDCENGDSPNNCEPSVALLYRSESHWRVMSREFSSSRRLAALLGDPAKNGAESVSEKAKRLVKAVSSGKIEMREVRMRQLFIDDEAFGDPIPLENAAEP